MIFTMTIILTIAFYVGIILMNHLISKTKAFLN